VLLEQAIQSILTSHVGASSSLLKQMTSPTHSISTVSAGSGRFSAPIAIAQREDSTSSKIFKFGDDDSSDGNGCDHEKNNGIDLYGSLNNRTGLLHNSFAKHEMSTSFSHHNDSLAYSVSDAESMQRQREMLRAMGESGRRVVGGSRRTNTDRSIGCSTSQSLPAPRAPFLSSRRFTDEEGQLSRCARLSILNKLNSKKNSFLLDNCTCSKGFLQWPCQKV